MNKLAGIGTHLKKIYRIYSGLLLQSLQKRGFTDLRPSFLEVLFAICEADGSSIKDIGKACGLKKQTMTSHLNELEKRGYIRRSVNALDKREQLIFLTDYGTRFKLNLLECAQEIEVFYSDLVGMVELNRMELMLKTFHEKTLHLADGDLEGFLL